MTFIAAQAETPALIGHADKSKYITIWSSNIIKSRSCAMYHQSDKAWLQGHSLSHLIIDSLNNHSFLLHSLLTPVSSLPHFLPLPLSLIFSLSFPLSLFLCPLHNWITDWFTAFITFLFFLPLYMLTCAARSVFPFFFSPSLVFYPPSPSVPLSLSAFIHPCHFVFSFLLCSFASNTAASSLLLLSSLRDTPRLPPSNDVVFLTHFSVSSFLLQLFLPLFPPPFLLYILQCLCVSPFLSIQPEWWLYWFSLWWYCPRTTTGKKTSLTYPNI